jgi:cellulose biosynthesis protein BcsQ
MTDIPIRTAPSPVVAIVNGKGGVGKSTLAIGLSAYTGQTHGSALLVDCDPEATAWEVTGTLDDPGYEVVHELDSAAQRPLGLTKPLCHTVFGAANNACCR